MTHIDNLCDALILAGDSDRTGEIYWIADEQPYTTNDIYETISELIETDHYKPIYIPRIISTLCRLVDKIIQTFGFYSTYIHVAGEMTLDIACDISKARRELNYSPKITLREGFASSIEWCRQEGLI